MHLGDITKIDGAKAPMVDVVIGGSPCQDLSIAGKRAGLDGERSGLFMEQIRIIKEMRDEANRRSNGYIQPRYMVWENVYGAFSSNKGEDFRIVLEETAKIADENAVIPRPADGKWRASGCIMADGWSIAWRVFDAQFWGVPQRRRRIALVADFGGQSAPEILFVRKSLSGHSEQGKSKRKETSSDASRSVRANDCVGFDANNGDLTGDKTSTIGVGVGLSTGRNGVITFEPGIASREGGHIYENVSGTLRANAGDNQMAVAHVYDARGNGDGKTVCTITGDHCNRVTDYTPVCITCDEKMGNTYVWEEQANTLAARDYKQPQAVCYEVKAVDCRNGTESDINATLQSNMAHSLNGNNVVRTKYIVRRLTPLECERLQGFPDGWTDIGEWKDLNEKKRKNSDANRYKALGNSIALPSWKWALKRICAFYERDVTMASLFDGIGGFPYLWEQLNGKGTCLWASEIEDFPIAVTKLRIGGD